MNEEGLVARRDDGDGVEILVLRHPKVNALSTALLAELEQRIVAIEETPAVRAVVVTGDGPYFSAGADLKEMATLGPADAPAIVRRGQALFERMSALRPPVIAAINGLALGGGLELALACDLRVAGESAKLAAPEANFGLLPAYGGTQRLTRLLGASKAMELVFTGTMIAGPEAARIGLVNKVVPAGQELRAARDLAHTIAQKAPRAIAGAKRAMRLGLDQPIRAGLELEAEAFERDVLGTNDLGEGIQAFIEHRPPKFTGT
ncbi:MAG TPA: enoyl-CoA hydratase-related protein [Thermoplasmata archaeon]|nr:enoyl-CoA hydratase-related protein [Thermoplasmata archaeon]